MDGQAQVRLVFAGEFLEGHSPDEVKRLFGEMFKLEGDRLAAVFSGQRTVLKREIGRDDGERYVARLHKLGMKVRVEPIDGLPAQAPVAAAVAAPPAETPNETPNETRAETPKPAGGLSLQELADEVQCPNCGHRQQKQFVLCKQCNTDIPRALESKREEAERARAERLAARQMAANGGRFAPPTAEIDGERSTDLVEPPPFASLSFEGRYGRASYINTWGASMLLVFAVGVVAAVLMPVLGRLIFLPLGLLGLAWLVWGVRVTALRLHDFNRSGWWMLLTLIPYLGIIVNLAISLWPGNAEENDYGPKPRRGNMVLAVAICVLSSVGLAVMAAVALPAYNDYAKRAQQKAEQAEEAEQQQAERVQEQAMPRLPDGPAAQVYRDQYVPAANEKAFAVSSAGAYGWSSGKASAREAMSAALSDCDTRREAYTGQCRIVSVNGLVPKER